MILKGEESVCSLASHQGHEHLRLSPCLLCSGQRRRSSGHSFRIHVYPWGRIWDDMLMENATLGR